MFIRDSVWEAIRERFSADEIAAIQSVVRGRVICPAGVDIDIDRLEPELSDKLLDLLNVRGAGATREEAR